ncbi:GntR family transcriptional regulator [Streptomyces pinistramenti]|uniref:GntR family transcriptional regulator n=1 Tax=Streptomyces pinistramenti TaxID=2884812 RepID=UPI001D0927CF|nr:GntR family transcriptional regulator [Streptomyces pinistramenti]MCB5910808.1 GntR family transcriptional regulator [Streptomyces pinistramenti]
MAKKYERIAGALRQALRAGRLEPGERLPAETALARQYGTSVPTMRDALAELLAEGLIDKRHGVGNFVREPRRRVECSNARHQREKDCARPVETERQRAGSRERDTGLTVSDVAFSAEYREAEAEGDLAAVFSVPVGTKVLRRSYRTFARDGEAPFSLITSYLVHGVAAPNPDLLDETKEPWPGGTQNQLFTVGIELDRVVERVTARPPTSEEAEELGLRKGVSVMQLRKISIGTTGRTVEVADVVLPGDRAELVFTTPLDRW